MKKISRRSVLIAAGLSAAALALAACGGSSSSTAGTDSGTASTQAITSLDDLKGKTVGVQLGTTGDIYMSDEVGGNLDIAGVEQYNKAADAVQALLSNKIDAVCIDDQVAKKFIEANGDKLTILDTAYAVEDYAACLSKSNTALTEQFNTAIAELKADGTLDAILDKFINKTEGAEGYVSSVTSYPNGTLTMATNAAFEPYEYIENGAIVGVDADFAKAICDKLGYDLVIEDMEFDAIIPAVQSGKADFGMAGMTVTEERLQNIDFTDSYCTGVQSIIVLK
jgi:polar amino acid transport system substrate-binding protein